MAKECKQRLFYLSSRLETTNDKNSVTIKRIKYISLTIAALAFAIYASSLLLRIDTIQQQVANRIADKIHSLSNLPLRLGAIKVRHFNKIEIDDILLDDLKGDTMISIDRLTLNISPLHLLRNEIRINTATLARPDIRIYKERPDSATNIQFLLDMFASNDTTTSAQIPDIKINQLQIYDGAASYHLLSAAQKKEVLDPNHISLSDISTNISLKKLNSDTLSLYIRKISGREASGLTIKKLRANIEASQRKTKIENFSIELPDSRLVAEYIELYHRRDSLNNKIEYSGCRGYIYSDNFTPADLRYLYPTLNVIPTLKFETRLSSTKERLDIERLRIASKENDIRIEAQGSVERSASVVPICDIKIETLDISKERLELLSPLFPEEIIRFAPHEKLGNISVVGNFKSTGKEINSHADIQTSSGILHCTLSSDNNGAYDIKTTIKGANLGVITGDNALGLCDAQIHSNGRYENKNKFSGDISTQINSLYFNNYQYQDILIDGNFTNKKITSVVKTTDPNLTAQATFEYDNRQALPHYKLKADIDTLCLHNLNLSEKGKENILSFDIDAEFIGKEIDRSDFSAKINNFALVTPEKTWKIQRFYLKDNSLQNERNLIIDSDIINGYITGYYHYKTLPNSFYRIMQDYIPAISSVKYDEGKKNNFVFRFNLIDSEMISRLFDLPITIKSDSYIQGNCADSHSYIALDAKLNNINLSGNNYRSISINGQSNKEKIICSTELIRPLSTNNQNDTLRNDIAIKTVSHISNDTLRNSVTWENINSDNIAINNGNLRFDIAIHKDTEKNIEFVANIFPSLIIHNNESWTLAKSDIHSKQGEYSINNFTIQNKNKELHIDGVIGNHDEDNLNINLSNIDIETLMNIVNFHSVELGGRATGNINLSRILSTPKLNGKLNVDGFKFENGYMGNMNFAGRWDEEKKAVLLNAQINDGADAKTLIDGFVSPANDTLNIKIEAGNLRIGFLNHMVSSVLSDVEGRANGTLTVRGSLGSLNLYGALAPTGRLRLKPTNAIYNLVGDSLKFDYNKIAFDNLRIKDIHNNIGTIHGGVYHRCLKNFTCKFDIKANNLLAYYSPDFGNDTFYGTAFVTGDINLSVDNNGTFLNANVKTNEHSKFIYNSAGPEGATDNNFVTFIDRKKKKEHTMHKKIIETDTNIDDIQSRLRLDFMIDVTPEMQLRVYTNTITDDYIDIYGNGPINAVYDEKEGFTMQGNLNLTRGTYKFTMQDIFPKEFDILPSSTLTFNGDPFLANLNLKTQYIVPSAPLTDLSITAERRKSVKVNCLMDITGTLSTPNLTFGLELPDGNEEEKELLASATSTPEQTNMQFIYLIGIGKFYPYDYNNQNNENQSSTMMESLISSTISGQLNNMLSQIIDNDNWNLSGNFTTSEKGWNSMEVEGMLSGRLLNNRLLINGNFGYRDNPISNKNFIGDFEVQWLLNQNGNISLKAYNKTNDRYFSKTTLTTQGAGLMLRHDFNHWLFWKKKKNNNPQKTEE